jgi:hypothetical protein
MMNHRLPSVQKPIVGAALVALVATAGCLDDEPAGPWRDWSALRLEVEQMPLLGGSVELRLDSSGGATRFETVSEARLLGAVVAEFRTATVMDRESGRTQRFESRSKDDGRRYLFGEGDYDVEKLSADGDRDRPLADWRVTSRRQFAYPRDLGRSPLPLLDYYGMIYHLRHLDLRRSGDEALVWVATSDGPVAYRLIVAESRESIRRYRDPADRSTKESRVEELRLRVLPADPDRAAAGFLRMEGETEIWVEARSKTLLQINGRVPRIPGTVRLTLVEIG